jgi:hypothetical protein
MTDREDPDLQKAFAALRAEDNRDVPSFGRMTAPARPARRRPWAPLILVPAAAVLAIVLVLRTRSAPAATADVVRLAGAWRSPTDFLLEGNTGDLLRRPSAIPDFDVRLTPASQPSFLEHD